MKMKHRNWCWLLIIRGIRQKFLVHTNKKRLKQLFEFCFDIVYEPGKENKIVDALSQVHEKEKLKTIVSTPICLQEKEIYEEVQ